MFYKKNSIEEKNMKLVAFSILRQKKNMKLMDLSEILYAETATTTGVHNSTWCIRALDEEVDQNDQKL